MLSAAVNTLIKEISYKERKTTLIPIAGLFQQEYYRPGSLVVKSQTSILSPSYGTSRFTLEDLLTRKPSENDDHNLLPEKPPQMVLEGFASSQKESISALLGLSVKAGPGGLACLGGMSELSNEFGMKVNGSDKVEQKMENVNLEKVELDLQQLCRKIDKLR